jgi:phospholipid/cholesterol/gamma-HCH transport system substrate-binding protein
MSERHHHILTGAIAVVLALALMTVGIKGSFGAFRGGYELVGRFDAAGQGLLPGSDVKVRGVNIGEVKHIELRDGEAEIALRINDGEDVPVDAVATGRPKTLFGEKYIDIDPGPHEQDGPYLGDGDELTNTLGGFELEAVLTDLYPILKAVDPQELTTVLGELAEGGRGLGETINRSIVNGSELASLFADDAELTAEFLTDLAALSDQLAASAGDVVATADAANVALPTLVDGEDRIVELLQQSGRLSNDAADLLERHPDFVEASFVDGSRTLQLLFDQQGDVVPLVIGLRQYLQTLAAGVRIDAGDGTLLAAVKAVVGGELCTVLGCPGAGTAEGPVDVPLPTLPTLPDLGALLPGLGLDLGGLGLGGTSGTTTTTDGGLLDVFRKALGG